MRGYGYNANGVYGVNASSGIHFGVEEQRPDGTTYFKTNLPMFVPYICVRFCTNYDDGEFGEMGSRLSGPYCERNVWFPTKKGTCKYLDLWTRVEHKYWLWIEAENLRKDMERALASNLRKDFIKHVQTMPSKDNSGSALQVF